MIPILQYEQVPQAQIFGRSEEKRDVSAAVSEIIAAVRRDGDAALFAYAEKFDGVKLDALEVPRAEIDAAPSRVDAAFYAVLEKAAANIRAYHSRQKREGYEIQKENGVILGQRVLPLDRVGIYVPGGTAAYPSTVLMDCIPAKLAGCGEIIMVTPVKGEGAVAPEILAAAKVAGVDRIFKTGGAQAVAALAYGTQSVPQVDKIVGPGNAFVAEAKRQVFGQVAIDMIAGPSEILVVADKTGNPAWIAADLLSQAEHDKLASAVLLTDSAQLAEAVSAEIEKQLPLLPRAEIARASIDTYGKIIVAETLDKAIEIANRLAPEHLELHLDDAFAFLPKIRHAGSVFLGKHCPEALGDYLAGPNHTLPTMGTARFSGPLSVDDFVKKSQYLYYSDEAFRADAQDVARFADTEGLDAHAQSARIRMEK